MVNRDCEECGTPLKKWQTKQNYSLCLKCYNEKRNKGEIIKKEDDLEDGKRIEKKTYSEYFEAIKSGKKRFEVRLADFDCEEGDILVLKEQDDVTDELTGRELECKILYKFNTKKMELFHDKADIEKHGLVVLSIKKK